ncbi:MAG: trehalose-phosphatase, partial [Pseudomonadota bacterium]
MTAILLSRAAASSIAQPPLPHLSRCALLLDVDGSLLEFRDKPEHVRANAVLVKMLARLQAATGGALAMVSGRPLNDLDRIFQPLRFSASGAHGAQLRIDSALIATNAPRLPDEARAALRRLAGRH